MLGLSQRAIQNIVLTGKVYEPENIEKAQSEAKTTKIWEKTAKVWIPGLVISAWSVVCVPLAFMASWGHYPGGRIPFSVQLIFISAYLCPIILMSEMVLIVISGAASQNLSRKSNHNEILEDSKQAELLKPAHQELFTTSFPVKARLQALAAAIKTSSKYNDYSSKVLSIYFETLANQDEIIVKKYIDFSQWYQISDRSIKSLQPKPIEVKGEKPDTFLADFEQALKA